MRTRVERDYYAILGIPEAASDEQIKRAYRGLALRHHPDRNPGDKRAEERFKEISQAYAVLMDPARRREYDRLRRGPVHGAPPRGATWREEDLFRDLFTDPRTASVFRDLAEEWARMGLRFNEAFVRDLFFGGRAVVIIGPSGIRWVGSVGPRARVDRVPRGAPGHGETAAFPPSVLGRLWDRAKEVVGSPWSALRRLLALPEPGRRRGDLEYEVVVSPGELRSGGRYRVTIERAGRTEELIVRMPPGLRGGTRLRLRGKGEPGTDGTTGDLFLRVRIGG